MNSPCQDILDNGPRSKKKTSSSPSSSSWRVKHECYSVTPSTECCVKVRPSFRCDGRVATIHPPSPAWDRRPRKKRQVARLRLREHQATPADFRSFGPGTIPQKWLKQEWICAEVHRHGAGRRVGTVETVDTVACRYQRARFSTTRQISREQTRPTSARAGVCKPAPVLHRRRRAWSRCGASCGLQSVGPPPRGHRVGRGPGRTAGSFVSLGTMGMRRRC